MRAKIKQASEVVVGDRIETTNGMRAVVETGPGSFKDCVFVTVADPASPKGVSRVSYRKTTKITCWPSRGCGCGMCKSCIRSQGRAEAGACD